MSNITKKDVVTRISEKTRLTQGGTGIAVDSLLHVMSQKLINHNNIEIRGFGRFKIKERKARIARNPRTGESVAVEAGVKPMFYASKELRGRVNSKLS